MTSNALGTLASQYLTFSLAGEEYAIEILRIREILEYGEITVVPKTPAWMRGVINLRGSVVPVVDLAAKLGLGATVPTRRTCIIIIDAEIGGERLVTGIMAESVRQVIDLGADAIEAAPSFGTRIDTTFLLGMARSAGKFTLLLDIDRLLNADEAQTISGALAGDDESVPESTTAA